MLMNVQRDVPQQPIRSRLAPIYFAIDVLISAVYLRSRYTLSQTRTNIEGSTATELYRQNGSIVSKSVVGQTYLNGDGERSEE